MTPYGVKIYEKGRKRRLKIGCEVSEGCRKHNLKIHHIRK